ncbi:MAG: T9SS type A sorting domain-containing protein [Bacteroidota bacterium]
MNRMRSSLVALLFLVLFGGRGIAQENHTHEHDAIRSVEEAEAFILSALSHTDYTTHTIKCLTPVLMAYEKYKNQLSPAGHEAVSFFLEQNIRSKQSNQTYISPSGLFRLEYSTTGVNAVPALDENTNGVPDYIEEAGIAADFSFNRQINELGHTNPIPDGTVYTIRFENLNGVYGFATGSGSISGPRTLFVVDNDFVGFPVNDDPDGDQLGALRVTIAHEFKHAIQFADNDWNGNSDRYAEMDATLMEEVVYDQVNDYYNYIGQNQGDLFESPNTALPLNSNFAGSYEDITYALFYHERFGDTFWPEVWDVIRENPSSTLFNAMDFTLSNYNSTFAEAHTEAFAWHYASGLIRSRGTFGFDESDAYPSPDISSTLNEVNEAFVDTFVVNPVSAQYVEVIPQPDQEGTMTIISDVDSDDSQLGVVALLNDGTVRLEYGEYTLDSLLVVSLEQPWNSINRVGVVLVNTSTQVNDRATFSLRTSSRFITTLPGDSSLPQSISLSQNYPNPFNNSTVVEVSLPSTQRITLDIYDVTGRLIQRAFDGLVSAGENQPIRISLPNIASGVYIYRLNTQEGSISRKLMLLK